MGLFYKKGEDLLVDMIREDYAFPRDEAMDISDLISQLSSLKLDHEDWFEEYPISDLIGSSSSSQSTRTPISSPHQPSQSSFDHFTFIPSLEDQIEEGGVLGRCWIVNDHHSAIHQDVIVKISSNLQNLQQEHHNLLHLNSSSSSSNLVINVYDDVLELGGRYGLCWKKEEWKWKDI